MENTNIDAILHANIERAMETYKDSIVTKERMDLLTSDELSEAFSGIIAQKYAVEILEVTDWTDSDGTVTYTLEIQKLKDFVFGFDVIESSNVESTTYFHFKTSAEAFQMLRELHTL